MKNKIKEDVIKWYENIESHDNETIENFVELIMDKTTDYIFEEIKKQFIDEFISGNLKHSFVISPDYYLELKLKEIKKNFLKSTPTDLSIDE
ncbi:MAG: hypothetical protein ACOC80_14990 [Petrotogales bacterium]